MLPVTSVLALASSTTRTEPAALIAAASRRLLLTEKMAAFVSTTSNATEPAMLSRLRRLFAWATVAAVVTETDAAKPIRSKSAPARFCAVSTS